MASTLRLSAVFHSPCSLSPPHALLPGSSWRNGGGAPCRPRHASPAVSCAAASSEESDIAAAVVSRRELSAAALLVSTFGAAGGALADADEDYKRETGDVIEQVRTTLALEKTDPNKAAAVAKLRQAGNEWVAKYRKSKKVAGKPSFSNMYSVINAISGHFVSFGASYPIPVKRKDRILDEMKDAEKALNRGR
jgi:photosystem II Psb27 protein